MLTRSQSRKKEQKMADEQEILEASSILTSTAYSAVDRQQTPLDGARSPSVVPPASRQVGIWHPRGPLPFHLARSLSASQLAFIHQVASDVINEARSRSDLHELKDEAVICRSAYENSFPGILEDEIAVKKILLCYEVIDQVDAKLRDLNLIWFLGRSSCQPGAPN